MRLARLRWLEQTFPNHDAATWRLSRPRRESWRSLAIGIAVTLQFISFEGSAKMEDKLQHCQQQYRIWKGLVQRYSPLWLATDGFISSLNDLPPPQSRGYPPLHRDGRLGASPSRLSTVGRHHPLTTPFYVTATVENFCGTLTSSKKAHFRRRVNDHLGRPVGLSSDMLAEVEHFACAQSPPESLKVLVCLKNWKDWRGSDDFVEGHGMGAIIWQEKDVMKLVEIFARNVHRESRLH
ncbi:hypothetical protein BV898_05694 [Hypsibius exemplaris]|uniref:Uncharacterized protein n=1 Tax=Hypsibius exemplaris TaxID=2072580 RepID=A0A1W0WYX7_HYPEX|nr:hypothetical protein BV898_05694 [Hypsibius exemplaris]